MKLALLAAALFVGWKLIKGSGGKFDFSVSATPGGQRKPRRPWAVPPGVNVFPSQNVPQNNAQYWASRTHPDSTMSSTYRPPTGGVLVGPTAA